MRPAWEPPAAFAQPCRFPPRPSSRRCTDPPPHSHAWTTACMLRLATKTRPRAPITHPWRSISAYPSAGAVPTSTPPSKYPTRGGQNLSARFQRLEKSVRGKGAYQRDIDEIASERAENEPESSARVRPARPAVNTFMGFVVPEEPKLPGPDGMWHHLIYELSSSFMPRMLHVRMRHLRPRPIRRSPRRVQANRRRPPNVPHGAQHPRRQMAAEHPHLCLGECASSQAECRPRRVRRAGAAAPDEEPVAERGLVGPAQCVALLCSYRSSCSSRPQTRASEPAAAEETVAGRSAAVRRAPLGHLQQPLNLSWVEFGCGRQT